ncbi:MAG: SCO family protein [Gammaproteobacteria bacterium]|nr:SCO family protein [Gammaproteobacteria bacterium]MBT3488702.1 SCO family protein [Gammaproteobacteria bacterium]MBT3717698.1 SCO family protein [Gammaproteobacteria bacterium]MBT3844948.1 SCO family protein [Gammaproteobacteria bacterium]MBT3892669.1 SCO family protein [Gammaproteobacteria bacterium]
MRSLILVTGFILLLGCEHSSEPPPTEGAIILPESRKVPQFELLHHGSSGFTNTDLKGKWSFFFYGYTHCPDVCPTELFNLAEMLRQLETAGVAEAELPQVVFVSVDPQRDLPEGIQRYVEFYHPRFKGVTAEQGRVDQLARSMGAIYEKVYYMGGKALVIGQDETIPDALKDTYLVNHSATIFLLNPEGELHAIFTTPHMPDAMVRDLKVIQQSGQF